MTSRALLCLPVLALALALGACGSSDSGGSSGAGSTTGGGAAQRAADCRSEAGRISDAAAREVALEACDALERGDGQVSKARSTAKQTCIDSAEKLPVESLKEQALKACSKID